MALKIYNTVSQTKEDFHPIEPNKVKMYVCGPTVYNYIHIGNARPAIFFDVVRRYFVLLGYDVIFIVNFTDVDDKMIRKAEEIGSSVYEVAEQYIAAYRQNTEALGIQHVIHPRVTENIPEIISFIGELVDKGIAYESGGDVYFRTHKFPQYGKISHQNLEELQFGIRIEVDERKENPQDFVLWKHAKPGEIKWSSPWGEGRPGWHIECSTMVQKYLGNTIDIHGGGQDLQFPHHECEVAQSEALTGKPLANYWMHNGYININDEKMSKSLGNGLFVKDLLEQTKPEVIRYFILSAHYRNPLNFSEETIQQAESALERLNNCLANVNYRMKEAEEGSISAPLAQFLAKTNHIFQQKMNDDFNTADAITTMFDLASETNRYLQQANVNRASLKQVQKQFEVMNNVLGILTKQQEGLLDAEIESLIQERMEARKLKNWLRADEIRNLLAEKNIMLEDTPQGIHWRRK